MTDLSAKAREYRATNISLSLQGDIPYIWSASNARKRDPQNPAKEDTRHQQASYPEFRALEATGKGKEQAIIRPEQALFDTLHRQTQAQQPAACMPLKSLPPLLTLYLSHPPVCTTKPGKGSSPAYQQKKESRLGKTDAT
eukprot:scaffold34432_cov22-Tisochrysis_lutea.AAC.1